MTIELDVVKFGGTSMGNARAMLQAAQLVVRNPRSRLVVVSATSGTTNLLLDIYRGALAHSDSQVSVGFDALKKKHRQIANDLAAPSFLPDLLGSLAPLFEECESLVKKLTSKESNEEAALDQLLSLGERISSVLFAQALRNLGADAAVFDVRRVLRTDSSFGKATPDILTTQRLCETFLKPALEKKQIWVTQGFIGSDQNHQTTTLGRGGSDFSAALLAEGLGAQEVQIWTDVNGIYTMDPNAVPNARRIENISFAEASELANFGAKVLHPATLWPAIRKNIRVFIGSTFDPDGGGTRIHSKTPDAPLIRAIAVRKNQTLITVTSLRMLNTHGYLAKLFSLLAKHHLSVDLVTTSEVSVALTIDSTSLGSSGKKVRENTVLLDELKQIAEVSIEEDLSLVAIIGNEMTSTSGISARAFSALHEFNLRLICHGASNHNLCFLVKSEQANSVATRLHQVFLEPH